MVTEKFNNHTDLLWDMQPDRSYIIRRMVENAIEKVVQRYNSPTAEPRGSSIETRVLTPEEKVIIDAANGLYGPFAREAVYRARINHPKEVGIYFAESDTISQTAPHLAENRRQEVQNNPAQTSAVVGSPHNRSRKNNDGNAYNRRYRRSYGPSYSSGGKVSGIYNSKIFSRLRPLQKEYHRDRANPAAKVLAFPNRQNQGAASQGTIDERVRKYKLPDAA